MTISKSHFTTITPTLIILATLGLLVIFPIDFIFIALAMAMLITVKYDMRIGALLVYFSNIIIIRGYELYNNGNSQIFHAIIFYLIPLVIIFVWSLRGEKNKLYLHSYNLTLLAFFFMMIFSVLFFSTSKSYGFEKLVSFSFTLLGCFTVNLTVRKKTDLYKYFYSLHIFGVLLLALCFASLFTNRMEIGRFYYGRFSTLGINPIWVARYLSYAILANIALIYKWKDQLDKLSYLIVITLAQFLFMLATGSRAPLLGLVIAISVIIVVKIKFDIKKLLTIGLVLLVIGILVMSISENKLLERFSGTQGSQKSTLSRVVAQYQAYELFRENIVFGGGFGSFKKYLLKYPHNIFSEVISEMGLLGFSILLLLLFFSVKSIKKIDHRKHGNIVLLAFLTATFVNTNLSGHLGINTFFWINIFIVNHLANLPITDSILKTKAIDAKATEIAI
ncbi:MAG: O-antigen ligase family protein [Candidatus Zophobacter franzmannii]|nr:O-antigen ligase family protein [Candidatus Zophobacter franzmannii]